MANTSLKLAGFLMVGAAPSMMMVQSVTAGTTLLSRQSYIQATGGDSIDKFNVSNGTHDFGRFANDVRNDAAVQSAMSEAHQYSQPGVTNTGLEGAFAEGSVKTGVHAPDANAWAESNFDVMFKVTSKPAAYTFGGALGTAGLGSAMIELMDPGTHAAVFTTQLDAGKGASQTIDRHGTLAPGTYGLHVHADSAGNNTASSAYYSVNFVLTPGAGGGVAAPLPLAVWTGLATLGSLATVGAWHRRKAA
jgi:hypothetical protein